MQRRLAVHRRCGTPVASSRKTGVPGLQRIIACCAAPGTRERKALMRRLWRALVIFLLGGVLGTGFGVALGFFVYPFVFPPPAAMDQLSESDKAKLVATGAFIHANPSDPVHWGRGKVSVYERAVFLESDFEVGPGPAFHVLLVPKAGIRSSADVKDLMYVDLGGLRSFKG